MNNKKPIKGYTRPQPLTYGPGPKYRNIPLHPWHDSHDQSKFNPNFDDNCQHDMPCFQQKKHTHGCRPAIPPPPFMHEECCVPEKRPVPQQPCHGPSFRPPMNCHQHREKYFYTILFLDNYYNQEDVNTPIIPPNRPNGGQLKSWDICGDTDTSNVHWIDENRLYVRHNLQMPITLQMWDNERNTIVYCPILKLGVSNVTMGDVEIDSERAIIINFNNTQKPKYNQVFHLAIRSLPDFSLSPEENDVCNKPLRSLIQTPKQKHGLALVFRRNTLDGLYDLISEFDDAYYHSLDDSADIRYLTDKSCYKEVHFVTKYTNNLQDVLDLIDVGYYKIEYSWQDHKKYRS